MQLLPLTALGIVTVCSVVLYVVGRRFARRFVELSGRMPPLTWMFRKTIDPDLERNRRTALALLPFYLVALAIYLLRP